MRRAVTGVVALAAALVLVGCTGQDVGPVPTPPVSSPPSTPVMPGLDQFTPPPSGLVDEDTGETVDPQPVPEWDEASRTAVIEAAQAAMTAFARPDLDYDTWWAGAEPLLTPAAAEDYAYVDPANIPVRKVTGEGFIISDASAYVATVEVPTDAGRYQLVLNRKNSNAPWLVSRITPVEGVHQ